MRSRTTKKVAKKNAAQCMHIKRSSQKMPSTSFCNLTSRQKASPSTMARVTESKDQKTIQATSFNTSMQLAATRKRAMPISQPNIMRILFFSFVFTSSL